MQPPGALQLQPPQPVLSPSSPSLILKGEHAPVSRSSSAQPCPPLWPTSILQPAPGTPCSVGLLMALLRYCVIHTCLGKCTVIGFEYIHRVVYPSPQSNFRTVSSPQKEAPYLLAVTPHSPPPSPRPPPVCSLSLELPLRDTRHEWDHRWSFVSGFQSSLLSRQYQYSVPS